MGKGHPFVKVSRVYEKIFSVADAHFCVTKAMKNWLKKEFGVNATVLYDKPPEFFRPTTVPESHDLCRRLPELQKVGPQIKLRSTNNCGECGNLDSYTNVQVQASFTAAAGSEPECDDERTLFTVKPGAKKSAEKSTMSNVSLRADRPALVMSCTSW